MSLFAWTPKIRTALLSASSVLLTSCALFVTRTDNEIGGRPLHAAWQLQKSTVPRVLQCVKGSIDVCASPRTANPLGDIELTPELRLKELAAVHTEITTASIHRGHVLLALLAKAEVPQAVVTKEAPKQAELISKQLPPEILFALSQLSPASAAISKLSAERVSLSLVTGAAAAETALSGSDAARELDRIRYNATGAADSGAFSIGKESFRVWLQSVRDATGLNGWSALSAHYVSVLGTEVQRLDERGGALTPADKERLTVIAQEAVTARLLGAYMLAYFNGGQVFAVDLNVKTMEQDAIAAIKKNLGISDPAAIKKLVEALLQQAVGSQPDNGVYHLLVKKQDGGFITRGGATYVFPGITITIDPTSDAPVSISRIDLAQVGSDLARVFVEGLGDGWALIPGDPKATGVTAKLLPRFMPPASGKVGVTADQFAAINDWANRVEGVVGSATGQAFRGISWISLNNEALAKMIETAVGVAARKGTEKLAWCVYACTAKPAISIEQIEGLSVNRSTFRLENR